MNQEHDIQSPMESESLVQPSFGTELRRAREQSGRSVEEVAATLFVRPQMVSALEAEDLSVFSAPVYAMGLLRSYARLLDINPEPLLAALEGMESGHEPMLTSVSKSARQVAANGHQFKIGWVVGAVVLLIAVGVGLYQSGNEEYEKSPAVTSEDAGAGTDAGPSADDLKASATTEGEAIDTAVSEPEGGDVANVGADASADAGAVDVKAGAGVDSSPVEDSSQVEGIAKPESSLLLTFDTDSWAEVHDAAGRRLLTRVGRAGQKLSLLGQAPFDVRLGYAPGVRIEYNGQPYVWESKKGSRVAHIKVGSAVNP